ncbi:MAG: helix-turn-helix domain-containing protein [Lachnospiraceae bacterium]
MTAYAVSNEIYGKTIRSMRKRLGLTQAELASLANVSVETIDQWESAIEAITGPIVTLVRIFNEYPQIVENMVIPENPYPLRLWYMRDNEVCTIIDVDERLRKVKVHNYTTDYISRAFGINDRPTFEEYEAFLESRCFPRTRDKMKLILADLGLPFYDPFLIIEKTEGRMAEDNYWIRIERGYE